MPLPTENPEGPNFAPVGYADTRAEDRTEFPHPDHQDAGERRYGPRSLGMIVFAMLPRSWHKRPHTFRTLDGRGGDNAQGHVHHPSSASFALSFCLALHSIYGGQFLATRSIHGGRYGFDGSRLYWTWDDKLEDILLREYVSFLVEHTDNGGNYEFNGATC